MRIKITHRRVTLALQLILLIEAVLAFAGGRWMVGFLSSFIILITLIPLLFERRFRVYAPPQLQLLAVIFVFATLFLGEVYDYYNRFWWWDIALHASSGFLLGILGFLLVHVMNETERLDLHMKPGFVAFFAFLFALGVGTVWEIFEFSMDGLFGMNMQKPMLGDPSGLTDTMWDLVVDALGALVISVLGYRDLKNRDKEAFLERWLTSFVDRNPRFFVRE